MYKISQVELESDLLRINLEVKDEHTVERIEIKEDGKFIPILGSFPGFSVLSFYNGKKSHSKRLSIKKQTEKMLLSELNDKKIKISLEIVLENKDLLHFKYDIVSKKKLNLTKLVANYDLMIGNNPDSTWVPHVCPEENFIIPDHCFRSPVIIYTKDKTSFALVPDLEMFKNNRPYKMLMDFKLKEEEYSGMPHLAYGFGNYKPCSHVLFKHDPTRKMNIHENTNLSFGYYIRIFKDLSFSEVVAQMNSFLWEKYGKSELYEGIGPQFLPYEKNVEAGYKAIFEQHEFFGNFKINGQECGGIWNRSWLGRKKQDITFIPPEQVEKYKENNQNALVGYETRISRLIMKMSIMPRVVKIMDWASRRFPIMKRVAEIQNNAWFLNIRTGYSFKYFGTLWNDDKLIDKGDRTLNTVLSLDRTRGLFPSVFLLPSENAEEISTVNGLKAFLFTEDFNTVDSCIAMYWALKFYQDFDKREDIILKSKELVDLIEEIQLENGAIPVFVNFEDDRKTPIIKQELINSASSGGPLMFLMEYYKISKDERVILIAEGIAKYLQNEIIPQDKWHDFECFYSCTYRPMDFYDDYTMSHCMNTLCIYWCAEGLKELYKVTKKEEHIKAGEHVISILSLFQQVWNMSNISFNTFGGFCSQNNDAEISDARQGLFVRVYMEYYLVTGKIEYMERGIATLRGCWAVQLIKENEEQSPGVLKGIDTVEGVDRGFVFENYGHSGYDMHVLGYMMFDWGVGSSSSATAYVKKHFGDIFIDFKENLAWGIDGTIVRSSDFQDGIVKIEAEIIPGKKTVLLKARDAPDTGSEIIINGDSTGLRNKEVLENGFAI